MMKGADVMQSRTNRKAFFPALDTLRFLAIIGVVFYHYIPHRVSGGFIGVDVFLVLSGFLTARSFLMSDGKPFVLRYLSYLRKRLIRIGLPLLTMLILTVAWCNAFAPQFLHNMRQSVLASVFFVNNWWQVAQGASYFADFMHPSPLTHLWYLGVQMQWYLLLPFLMLVLSRTPIKAPLQGGVIAGLALLSVFGMALIFRVDVDPSRIYYGTDTHAFGFLLGSAVAYVWRPEEWKARLGRLNAPLAGFIGSVALVFLVLLAFRLQDTSPWTYRGGLFIASMAAVVLMCTLTVRGSFLTRLFSLPMLRFLGRLSFSLYLWYYPVLTISNAYPLLRNHVWLQWLILLLLGVLSFFFVERLLTDYLLRHGLPTGEQVQRLFQKTRQQKPIALSLLAVLLLVTVSFTVGMVRAPSGINQTVAEMEAQIEENRRLLQEKEQTTAAKPITLSKTLQDYNATLPVTFIGDSVLLAASQPLVQVFPEGAVDAEVGRQLTEGVGIIRKLEQDGRLFDTVVVVLGSNGAFTDEQIQELITVLGKRRIYLVNTHVPRPWQDDVNDTLDRMRFHYDNVHLINWNEVLQTHPDWLYEDNIHTNPEGSEGFTAVIAHRLFYDHVNQDWNFYDFIQKGLHKEADGNPPT